MKMVRFDLGRTLEDVIDGQDILLAGSLETLQTIQGLKDAHGSRQSWRWSLILAKPQQPEQIAASQKEYFRILDNLKIRRFFEPVAQRVTLSTEAGTVKPSKKIFRTAINKIPGLRFSDVIFITEEKKNMWRLRGG